MKTLRQLHLYLGCVFAPLIIYFSISGAWQIFRLNDLPEGDSPSVLRSALHALSNPHTHSTLPGLSSKIAHSQVFDWIALAMSIGLAFTAVIGLLIAFKYSRSKNVLWACIAGGLFVPMLFLLMH